MPLKSPALFRRIPVPRAASSCPLLPDGIEETEEYEALASDITFLREKLFGDFKSLDVSALESQNAFRRAQFLLIMGGLIATILGSVQAAFHSNWAGIAETGLVLVLVVLFLANGRRNFKQDYLDQRLKAERLRAECFFFLARVGAYSSQDGDGSRELLTRRVNLIKTGSAQ